MNFPGSIDILSEKYGISKKKCAESGVRVMRKKSACNNEKRTHA